MASGYSDQCSVAVTNSYNTCGTVTRSNLSVLTPTQIKALYSPSADKWAELSPYFKHQIEMKACGIRRSALYDWIMSSNKPGQGKLINVVKSAKGPSLIEPFVRGRQQSVINTDHWYVTANVAGNAYTPGALDGTAGNGDTPAAPSSAGNRVLTLKSTYGGTGLDLDQDYFLPGKRIYLMSKTSGTNAWSIAQFKVVQAAHASDRLSVDVEVTLEQKTSGELANNSTSATGLVFVGPNNVHDVEKWCKNAVNTNGTKLVPFWYQTRRWQRCVDSEYKKIFSALMENNAWYATFQDLPLSERNRQDELRDQKEFLVAFFFGTAISANQTITGWGSLPTISSTSGLSVDAGTSGKLMAYRANMIGIVPQLNACGQFSDSAGAALEIKPFLETTIYDIYRARESQGRQTDSIDIYTSTKVADQFNSAYIAYAKEKNGGDIVRINLDAEAIKTGTTKFGWPFRSYRLYTLPNVTVNILTDSFFDDLDSAFSASTINDATLGKFLFVLDLGAGGSIYPAVLASNRKQYTSGQIEDLAKIDSTFSCVMENPTIERTLVSTTTTAVVECPKNSIIVANFSRVQHTPA